MDRDHVWRGEEDDEDDENWASDDESSGDGEPSSRGPNNAEEEDEEEEDGFADEYDEEEENNVDDEEEEEEDDDDDDDDDDMEGFNGIIQHQQLEQHQGHHVHQPFHNGSSQTETTSSGEDGRHYYMQNGDGLYTERLGEHVGEDEIEYPNDEMIKTGDDEGGYNENGVDVELLGKDMDAEKMVPIIHKGPGKAVSQKRKSLASMGAFGESSGSATKKAKKKNTNVWAKSSSRKGGKKNRAGNGIVAAEDTVNITPVVRVPDKIDDSPDLSICLSKIYKAEKVELSDDRLTASSTKGYRMVRATRGVVEGAWYFEIKVVRLGETGHTRLGWSTEKGDVQAPVGYDANSYSYRDLEGSKVHKAVREPYGDAYVEGDVIGFYINLPDGSEYAPKPPQYAWHKNQLYYYNNPEETPKIVPGSEILFFRNGKCQGIAFKDIIAGRYYPAASMYTLPNKSPCIVQFNFGPDFDCFPEDFGDCSLPMPMNEAPYCGINGREIERGEPVAENSQTSEKKT